MNESLIVSDPAVMMGKPVVAGTRLTVELIMDKVIAGESVGQIVASYPQLTPADVLAAVEFAEDEFDRKLAATGDKLAVLAEAALAEYRAGETEPLDPDRL